MLNPILPESEVTLMKEVIEKVDAFVENHKNVTPTFEDSSNSLNRIHTIMYLEMTKELVSSAMNIKHLLEMSEDEFTDFITDGGKTSVEQFEKKLMLKVMLGMIAE